MVHRFTHLDLFAGIGGFSRAVEWLGGTTVGFVEWDAWCRKVLHKHWPKGTFYGDIHKVSPNDIDFLGPIDLITGGYPCQPFSVAGKRMGHDDPRHLWPEMRRIVNLARPRFVLAENVSGHVNMGLDTVLADLEADGYACGAIVIPACAVNALHRRDRVWIMAHAEGISEREPRDHCETERNQRDARLEPGRGSPRQHESGTEPGMADAAPRGVRRGSAPGHAGQPAQRGQELPDAISARQPGPGTRQHAGNPAPGEDGQAGDALDASARSKGPEAPRAVDFSPHEFSPGLVRRPAARPVDLIRQAWADGSWERDLPRVVAEEPERRQKLQAAGNAIVPIVAYEILNIMLEEIL